MKKIDVLIDKLHEVADFVDRTGMSEDIELIGRCIDLACEIRDGKEETNISLPQEIKDVLSKQCSIILNNEGLSNINGGFCTYEVNEEFDNGWSVYFIVGVQDDTTNSKDEFMLYLRKDTLELTTDEEEVEFEPEED